MIVKRCTIVMVVVATALLSSCNRNSDAPGTPAASSKTPATNQAANTSSPFLRVHNNETHSFHGGTKLYVWTLQGYGIKELTIRLVHISNGQSKTATESVLTWNEATASKTSGKILFLIQDGQAFGANEKHSPSLSVTFDNVHRRVTASPQILELNSRPAPAHAMTEGSISEHASGQILYNSIFVPPERKGFSLEGNLDSMIEESKNGTTFVAITLDWEAK